jgi:hypothetical protein
MANAVGSRMLVSLGAAVLLTPTAALIVTRRGPAALDPVWMYRDLHFWTTGVTALLAAGACAVLLVAARSLRETRLLFLALAFVSIAGIFSVHGLLTPGVIKEQFHAPVAVSAWVSVSAGAAFVAMSAIGLSGAAERFVARIRMAIFAWTAIAVAAYILMSWNLEHWLDRAPTDDQYVQYGMAVATMALYALALVRYGQAWFFARLPSQAAMAISIALLLQIPPILLWGEPWHASWWSYHIVYAAAFAVLFAGWAIEWHRAGNLRAIADALSMRDALSQLNRGRDAQVIQLVDAIEAKDDYTHGHVHRVGSLAYEIGKRLGLSQSELRDVVLAAQMHDVGKIRTPDAILQKPAALNEDETAEMRRHTVIGGEIAGRVRPLRTVAAAVRAHHERYGGGGYPDGLAGDDIPLAARIVSVADTYDAMTSARPYRQALSHDAAVAEVIRVRGTQLDPRCVDAFLSLFESRDRAAA